uniref:HupE/UreJ family protein n=1 Tax=Magnetococcus massalia (strain MO-1) TaxID=451514 RepID=A0A1S7LDN5_MAGMO|nr:Conserved membrane protein of unknown function [Candidatus Magnetococcus massalia]
MIKTVHTLLFALWLLVACALPNMALAHEVRPAIVDVTFQTDGHYDITISLNLEAVLAGIGPQHQETDDAPTAATYDALRKLSPAALQGRFEAFQSRYLDGITLSFDQQPVATEITQLIIPEAGELTRARLSKIVLRGQTPPLSHYFQWQYRAEFGHSALRIRYGDQPDAVTAQWLKGGKPSRPFSLKEQVVPASRWQVSTEYLLLGFTHILPYGLDHILFVLGLFLLSLHWRPLLYQITAFTLAHTITLGLTIYGVISLSPTIVEPLIALSIVYLAVENSVTTQLKPWRVALVFAFGLLHGMGFAGVLTELGLPRSEFVTALIAFNLGVEGGQLAVVSLAFLAVGLWFGQKRWYHQRIVVPVSVMIGLVGAYWTVERIVG